MSARSLHRLVLDNPATARTLLLEPWGMTIAVAVGDEIVVEVTAVEPPDFDADSFTIYAGEGAELRVTRHGHELYSTAGNPVPSLPPGMSTRDFLNLIGVEKPRR